MKKYFWILFAVALVVFAAVNFYSTPATSACSDDDGHDHAAENKKADVSHAGHDHAAEKHDHAAEKKNEPDAHADHDHGDEEEAPVQLNAAQKKLVRIKIEKAQTGFLERTMKLNGEIRLNLDKTARLMPRLPGFVTEVAAKEGQKVAKGQLLARLTSHKLGEYYSDYNSAAERRKLALSEFKMAETLFDKKAMSEREYLRYKREYAESVIAYGKADVMLRSLLLDPGHTTHSHEPDAKTDAGAICTEYEINAPYAGTVIARDIALGENFAEDNERAVFVVSDLDQLWLELRATSAELRQISSGMHVTTIPSGSRDEYKGVVRYIGHTIDENSRTALVRVLLDNPRGTLRPGEFATGIITLGNDRKQVIVPRTAIQLIDGENVVFVPRGTGYAPVAVKIGRTADGRSEILSGLKVGQPYVGEGAFELKSILLTSGMDPHAGHGH